MEQLDLNSLGLGELKFSRDDVDLIWAGTRQVQTKDPEKVHAVFRVMVKLTNQENAQLYEIRLDEQNCLLNYDEKELDLSEQRWTDRRVALVEKGFTPIAVIMPEPYRGITRMLSREASKDREINGGKSSWQTDYRTDSTASG